MKEKIYCQKVWHIHPFNSRLKFLHQIMLPDTGTLQSCQNLDHCPIRNKFFSYQQFRIYIYTRKCFYFQTCDNI